MAQKHAAGDGAGADGGGDGGKADLAAAVAAQRERDVKAPPEDSGGVRRGRCCRLALSFVIHNVISYTDSNINQNGGYGAERTHSAAPGPGSAELFHPDDLRAKNYFGEPAPITNLGVYA